MKLHQLRHLVAVAAEGSIRGAARSQGLSQATVTQSLRELEADVGVALLVRHGQGIALTAAGHDLLQHAQRLLAQWRQAEDTLAQHRAQGESQRLAIAVTPWVANTLLPRLMGPLRTALPLLRLEVFEGLTALAYPKLRDGSIDLYIGRIAHQEVLRGLQALPLFRYDMAVVARKGHPLGRARHLAALADAEWVLNHAPGEGEVLMHHIFGQHGVAAPPPHRVVLAHSASQILALVGRSERLSFCPWPLLEGDGFAQSLEALPLQEGFGSHVVGFVRRAQEAPSPTLSRFIEVFLGEVPGWAASRDRELKRVMQQVDVLV